MYKAIINLFRRFTTPELAPYKSLIENFEERWRGDSDSDRKLLSKLLRTLEKIPDNILDLFENPIDAHV